MTAPRPPRDPGLQTERTRLAWRRTSLAASAVAVLLLVAAMRYPPGARALLVAATGGTWLAMVTLAHRRITALTRGVGPARRSPALLALLVLALVGLGAAVVLRPA